MITNLHASKEGTNKILAAVEPTALRRLDARIQHVRARDILFDAFQDSPDVFFPHAGTVISLVRGTDEGSQIEVGLVGSEGFASIHSLFASSTNGTIGVAQVDGDVTRVGGRRLRNEFATDVAIRSIFLGYASLYVEHLTQSVVCNSVHTIEQRLAKWLLIIRDRINADEFVLSHDFLSKMLGIQRSGITLAVGSLTDDGLINHSRKHIGVRDSEGLRGHACECYGLMIEKLNDYRTELGNSRVH